MTAVFEGRRATILDLPIDLEIFVHLTNGASRIRAAEWEQATWLRRKLHQRGWVCTSPSPISERRDYCFFVTRGPATLRRNLVSELQSIPGICLVFETE